MKIACHEAYGSQYRTKWRNPKKRLLVMLILLVVTCNQYCEVEI